MRTMLDALNASRIPISPPPTLVAGYVDRIRLAPWTDTDWARFPHSIKVRIVKKASTVHDGHVLDVETGDAKPAEAPGWVRGRRAAGADPTVYCSASVWPAVQSAFVAAKVAQPHYWIAHYDGDPALPTLNGIKAVAKQFRSNNDFDTSSVADVWPGVDSVPEVDMHLTDKLDPNAGVGTVNEALNAVLHGIGGVRQAGPLAMNVLNTLAAVNAGNAHLASITGALKANQAALLGAIATAEQHVDVTLTPEQLTAITTPITTVLNTLPLAVKQAIGQALVGS